MEIPFLGGAYEGRSKSINAQQSINMFPVFDDNEGKNVIAMYGTPGTDDFCDTGTSAVVRRLHVMGDYLYASVGNVIYEVDTGGNATNLGTITTSTGHVGMADNGTQLLICDGTTDGYIATEGLLTAVADMTSWEGGDISGDNYWTSVTYGNGLFVAVAKTGTGNRIMTSADGVDWTIGESPTLKISSLVAEAEIGAEELTVYYPDRFADGDEIGIVLDNGDTQYTTVDGAPTTTITLADALEGNAAEDNFIVTVYDCEWSSVTYGNSTFVAVAKTGTYHRVMTSSDGLTWEVQEGSMLLKTTTSAAAVATDLTIDTYYPDRFSDGDTIGIELDDGGEHWTTVDGTPSATTITLDEALPSAVASGNSVYTFINNDWSGVVYGGGTFVAVSNTGTGDRVMTSPEGEDWTIRVSAADNDWTSIAYGNEIFVAVANSGTGDRVMTSSDAITWTSRTSAADNDWTSVTYGLDLFVAVASSGTGDRVMTSPDGITWTSRTSAADNDWTSVAAGDLEFTAVANTGTGDRIMVSEDGITWESKEDPTDNDWTSVAFGNSGFAAVSTTGVMVSPSDVNNFPAATDCVFFDGYFIVSVADSGRIQVSGLYDGASWNALDFATAEASPDILIGIGTTRQNVWLFGEYSTEVYYNSGNADFPFQRVPGAILDIGCGSLTSVAEIEGVLYWLSNKKTIVMNSGYSFDTISTEAINYQLSTYSTVADAVGYSYSLEGRTFYVISFPTADKTWVVNIKDMQWHEWSSLI